MYDSDTHQNNENPVVEQQLPSEPARPGLAELIYGVLFTPVETFRKITEEPPLFSGFLVFVVVAVLTSLTGMLVPLNMSGMSPELAEIMGRIGPLVGIIGGVFSFITWFIWAGVLHLIAELFNGKGRALTVLTVLAFAGIPRVIVIPFQIISYFSANSLLGSFLTIVASLAVFVWWAVLVIIGLREAEQLSTGRAVATLLTPYGIVLLVAIIFIVSLVGVVIPILPSA